MVENESNEGTYSLGSSDAEEERLQSYIEAFGQRRLLKQIKPGMKILDVGCGAGSVSMLLAQATGPDGTLHGVDLEPEQLDRARARAEAEGLSNTTFQTADATRLPFKDESFDFIYAKFLLLHLPDPMAALADMYRVLRPGGTLFIYDIDTGGAMFWPPGIPAEQAWDLIVQGLTSAGADVHIGRKLFSYLDAVGLQNLQIRPESVAACAANPHIRKGATIQLRAVLRTLAERVVERGFVSADALNQLLEAMVEERTGELFTTSAFAAWGSK